MEASGLVLSDIRSHSLAQILPGCELGQRNRFVKVSILTMARKGFPNVAEPGQNDFTVATAAGSG
jgi:hypothetical protein